jgi:hypothetical protein
MEQFKGIRHMLIYSSIKKKITFVNEKITKKYIRLFGVAVVWVFLVSCIGIDYEGEIFIEETQEVTIEEKKDDVTSGSINNVDEIQEVHEFPHQTGTLWAPYLEWSISNISYSGNPFDLIANAKFTHLESGEIRNTQMFYAGDGTWKFRFTGTRTGEWSFTTESSTVLLDGLSGSITIYPNPNPIIKGFITAEGSKFARQVGEDGELEGYLFNVYQDNLAYPADFWDWVNNRSLDYIRLYPAEQWAEEYLNTAREHGSNTIFIALANQWFEVHKLRSNQLNSENPELLTFDMLERVITTVHEKGGHIHIWKWGDEERRWTPIGVPGGINGSADRRLQRYISARLGPLPGWTMSYGFDLHEWVTEREVESWANYMYQHLGWPHLLSARAEGRFRTPGNMDIHSVDARPSRNFFITAVDHLSNSFNRPVLYERRFYHGRDGVWNMDNTRRAMWEFTMAGGVGSHWGVHHSLGASSPYPNPEQMHTYRCFWDNRYLLDMDIANNLTNGLAVKSETNAHFVFYGVNTSTILMNLSDMAGNQPAVAVDTKGAYNELNLGILSSENQVWDAPYNSDWAVAVGTFNNESISSIPLRNHYDFQNLSSLSLLSTRIYLPFIFGTQNFDC